MYHNIYSVSGTPQPGVPADQQGYVQQFETQPQGDQNQRPNDSSGYGTAEFSSIFASLYSNPQQQTQDDSQLQQQQQGGEQQQNYQDQFYQQQPGGYYIFQPNCDQSGMMMPDNQQQQFGYGSMVDFNGGYNKPMEQSAQDIDSCYMPGSAFNGENGIKSDYVIMKEQQDASTVTQFYLEKCSLRQALVNDSIKELLPVVQALLKEVELQEPRFVYQLMSDGSDDNPVTMLSRSMEPSPSDFKLAPNTRIPSIRILSTNSFQIILFLSQMTVFNFIDDGSLPGYAALKLCDGRKRSMSLWVEFITASGYLSAKKLRARFQALLMAAVDKIYAQAPQIAYFNQNNGSLVIYNKYSVSVVPGFRCKGCWPASARNLNSIPVGPGVLYSSCVGGEMKPPTEDQNVLVGFTLVANEVLNQTNTMGNANVANAGQHKEEPGVKRPQATADSDTWQVNMFEAEKNILNAVTNGCSSNYLSNEIPATGRVACLRLLKTIRDRVDGLGVINNHILTTLVLWEWEKHPNDSDWLTTSIPDRIRSILLQLINCFQNKRLDHYLLANVNILSETAFFNGQQVPFSQITTHYSQLAWKLWQIRRQLTLNFNDINNFN